MKVKEKEYRVKLSGNQTLVAVGVLLILLIIAATQFYSWGYSKGFADGQIVGWYDCAGIIQPAIIEAAKILGKGG